MQNTMWTKARAIIDERRSHGDKRDCFIDTKLDEYEAKGWPMSQHAFNYLFGVLLEAGADTTANQILTLILALAKYPEIQKRARKEIDALCGPDRAPLFTDFDQLPYINCIVKEGMRWRPTYVPSSNCFQLKSLALTFHSAVAGLPHLCTQGQIASYRTYLEPVKANGFVE
jgi:cytochrome P450